jgi:lipopolysaccharide export system protein LptA
MSNKIYYILIPMLFLLSIIRVSAENNFPNKQSDKPMEITSNSMDVLKDKKLVVFSGNTKVMQGNSVLKSDKLFFYYKYGPDKKQKNGILETNKTGKIERIEAKGNVYLNHEEKIATGDEAIYLRDSNKVIMTGNATLNDGKSSIKGDRVIVFLDENRGIVEGTTQKRVKASVYPKDVKKTEIK